MARKAKRRRHRHSGDQADAAEAAPRPSADSRRGARRGDLTILAAIVLCAFALRFVYVLQWRSSPIFEHPKIDELYHDQWAKAIAAGEIFVEGAYFRAPLYPAFLGAIYKVFGHGYLMPRVVQAALSALTCGLLFLIGRTLFGRAVGAVAGFAAASYWSLIFFDGELLIPPLIIFLDLLLLWLLIRAARTPGKLAYGLAGAVLGLSALARPNVLLFGPAIVIWLVVAYRRRVTRAFVYAGCVTAGCLLMVLPITVRNYVVGNDFVLIASQGGLNFYIGNNPHSDGRTAIAPGERLDFWGSYERAILRAEDALGRKLKPSEVSDYHYKLAWDFIRQQPGKALALTVLKLRLFWSRYEIANNKNLYFWTERFTPIVRFLPLGFGVIGPLGILGLVLCRRRGVELFPLWGFVLVYMLSVVLFFCTARYRMPVIPVLILLAVYAVFQGVSAVRQARWKSVAGGLVALAFATAFVNVTPHTAAGPNDFISHVMLGDLYDDHGRPELGVEHYRRALAIVPGDLAAAYGLGSALTKLNRLPEGIADFRRVLTGPRIPRSGETVEMLASVHSNFANALARTGDYAEAIEHYRAAIGLEPRGGQGSDQFNLGLVLDALGRHDEALDAFEQVIEANPDFPPAHFDAGLRTDPANPRLLYGLGHALLIRGQYNEALAPLGKCLRLDPGNVRARRHLKDALTRLGRHEEAAVLSRASGAAAE